MPPPLKRAKVEQVTPQLQALVRHPLQLPASPSPAAPTSCRVAVQVSADDASCEVYYASGRSVYCSSAPLGAAPPPQAGKEGVFIATAGQALACVEQPQLAQQGEVQSIALMPQQDGTTLLACADAYGRAAVQRMGDGMHEGQAEPTAWALQPPSEMQYGEAGWAGIVLTAARSGLAALARHYSRDVMVFDGERCVRCMGALACPTDLAFLPLGAAGDGVLLAAAEGNQVTVYDTRAGERGGVVQRLAPRQGGGTLYALACHAGDEPLLAAGGADRGVSLWDCRKWALRESWTAGVKHEITRLQFCGAAPSHMWVGGADWEVLCGSWQPRPRRAGRGGESGAGGGGGGGGRAEGPTLKTGWMAGAANRGLSFRGASRWLGLAAATCGSSGDREVVACYSSSGSMYVAQVGTTALTP